MSIALFVAGLLLAAQPMTEHHHPVQRVWLEVCTGLVGVSFLLPFVVYYACVLLFPCVLALLASAVATEAGNAAVGAGASSSARGLSAEALAALPPSTYAARRAGGAGGDAAGGAARQLLLFTGTTAAALPGSKPSLPSRKKPAEILCPRCRARKSNSMSNSAFYAPEIRPK